MLISRRLKKVIVRMYANDETVTPSPILKILGNDLTAVSAAILVLLLILFMTKSKDSQKKLQRDLVAQAEIKNRCVAAEYIGKYISEHTKSKSNALIILNEFSELQKKHNELLLAALKKGFAEKITIKSIQKTGKSLSSQWKAS